MDPTKGSRQARRRRAATDAIGIAHHASHKPLGSNVRLIHILLVGREVKHNFLNGTGWSRALNHPCHRWRLGQSDKLQFVADVCSSHFTSIDKLKSVGRRLPSRPMAELRLPSSTTIRLETTAFQIPTRATLMLIRRCFALGRALSLQ